MAFKPGQAKPVGSGRKIGQRKLRDFYELLDAPGFSLRDSIRTAVGAGDTKMVAALAQLWRALATTPLTEHDGPSGRLSDDQIDEQLLKVASSGPA